MFLVPSSGDGVAHLSINKVEDNQRSDGLHVVKYIIPLSPNMVDRGLRCNFSESRGACG